MNDMSHLRVGIACNIRTDDSSDAQAEFDEPGTVAAISEALRAGGFEPIVLEASDGFLKKLETEKPDIVFNIAEGKFGRAREAHIPSILEYFGVPYTGSDATALAVSLDKALTKRVVRSLGIKTPDFFVIQKKNNELPGFHSGYDISDLPYPVIIKPNAEGSSKGISDACVAANPAKLREITKKAAENNRGDLLAEQYIDGREFTVGMLGNGSNLRVFEPMEIVFQKQKGLYKVYSYEVKKNYRTYIAYRCPAELTDYLKAQMVHDAKAVYEAIGCRDFARIDFRISENGKSYLIEVNLLPGLAPEYSDFPMLAEFNGISYNNLICGILHCALKRYRIEWNGMGRSVM
ncbi:MAG: ATP-grasp domain-containing protein [Oscillospiraceae bacterium]|nr:ATP-grasp domain-containing protein [Oscillospiraceae bacterium]